MKTRIEKSIDAAMDAAQKSPDRSAPPQLKSALTYAVKPGGARIRPTILLSVAMACGDDAPAMADAAAASLELIHCASLVHDDMPCFDDADFRRGKPTVHKAFSEELALLTGDSLIVLAFQTLTRAAAVDAVRAIKLLEILTRATGSPDGICAGQAWEGEPMIDIDAYHRAKTGALFIAATCMGAAAAGHEPEDWVEMGARIGQAFQIADDLADVLQTEETLGKPVGQDEVHGRPNAVTERGVEGAIKHLEDALESAITSIPSCPGEGALCELVRYTAEKLTPVTPTARVAIRA